MPNNIEAFVERLQKEGIEAGRVQAARALEEAKSQAEEIRSQAQAEAERIVEEAEKRAAALARRSEDELKLAVRDAVLALRERIVGGLDRLMREAVSERLAEPEFLGGLVREVVTQYAGGDATGKRHMEVKVSDATLEALAQRALADLVDEQRLGLAGALKGTGFEYSVAGGKVEVTADSVGAILADLASPRLREIIDAALATEA